MWAQAVGCGVQVGVLGYRWVFWGIGGCCGAQGDAVGPCGRFGADAQERPCPTHSTPHSPLQLTGSEIWVTPGSDNVSGHWGEAGGTPAPGWGLVLLGTALPARPGSPGAEVCGTTCSGRGRQAPLPGSPRVFGEARAPMGEGCVLSQQPGDQSKSVPGLGSVPEKPLGSRRGFIPTPGEPGDGPWSRRAPQGEVLGWMWPLRPGGAGCC